MQKSTRASFFVFCIFIYTVFLSAIWPWLATTLNLAYPAQLVLNEVLLFLAPAFVYLIITKQRARNVLRLKPLKFHNILLIIVIALFIQPCMSLLSFITALIFPNNVANTLVTYQSVPLYVMLISMAVTPAICEEIVFRGIVFSDYENLSLPKAALGSGLLFGMMHMDLQQFLYAAVIGMIFCYLVYKTGSIFSSMLAHFVINGFQVGYAKLSLALAQQAGAPVTNTSSVETTFWGNLSLLFALLFLIAITLPVLICAFYAFHKINPGCGCVDTYGKPCYPTAKGAEERLVTVPFVLSISFYVVIVICIPFILYLFMGLL